MKKIEKRYVVWAFAYLIAGLLCGVYYREFSKAMGFVNQYTPLAFVHPHLIILGTIFTILIGFLLTQFEIKAKSSKVAFIHYNIGVIGTAFMLLIRGTYNVIENTGYGALTSAASGVISGISGCFHIVMAAGIVIYFVLIIKSYKKTPEPSK